MTDLFATSRSLDIPLAERLRPQKIEDVIGQRHVLGEGGMLHSFLNGKYLPSLIVAGPPGCGKTTIAKLLAAHFHRPFVQLSAVFAGVADLRKVYDEAGKIGGIVLFIDEIHRFNKAQQDALLGPIESGLITLIGATTENPSFSLNSALLSRCQVITFHALNLDDLEELLLRAEASLSHPLPLTNEARQALIQQADGDGRMLINYVEILATLPPELNLKPEQLAGYLQRRAINYDRDGDYHYNLISAMIKSLRGSDPDAALYWMARMLHGGETPLYITRRLIRFAVEDIGLADPQALIHAVAAEQAYERLGSPEGELAVVNSLLYLATAPKSNRAYMAYKRVKSSVSQSASEMPPKHILNPVTKYMKDQGFGHGYIYDHDTPEGFSGQNYFPDSMKTRPSYYEPVERGFERDIRKRLEYWQKIRHQKDHGSNDNS